MSHWNELIGLSRTPYSGHPEACLIRGREAWHLGVRIENITYPQTITALQGGMAACLFAGDLPEEILLPPSDVMPAPADLNAWIHGSNAGDTGDAEDAGDAPLAVRREAHPPVDIAALRADQRARYIEGAFESGLRLDSVDRDDDAARRHALGAATSRAVIPNSDFPVSALLETDIGVVVGCNVEFPAWNLGLCAERNAIHLALSMGASRLGDMAILAPKSQVCSPCGACRQTLSEWPGIRRVLLYHGDGSSSIHLTEDLLPFHFHASSLSSQP
jgi:homotetrameric cytidine deaminase